jgi:phosphoribosylglycinamide formyltransferase 1
MPRAIVLTSTAPRHHFLIHAVAQRLDVVGVWQEEKKFAPFELPGNPEDRQVIAAHFGARDDSEARYFHGHEALQIPGVARRVPPGGCNDAAAIVQMVALEPDVVVVFGTELLRQPLLDTFRRLINLHLGLSPYYRGSGTNFWPLVNGEPEYVGATIHFINAGLDSGPIIAHVRPDIQAGDDAHDIGNRTVVAAAPVVAAIADASVTVPLPAFPQEAGGRLYFRRHFTADAVRQMNANFANGMVGTYLADRQARDRAVAIVRSPV